MPRGISVNKNLQLVSSSGIHHLSQHRLNYLSRLNETPNIIFDRPPLPGSSDHYLAN